MYGSSVKKTYQNLKPDDPVGLEIKVIKLLDPLSGFNAQAEIFQLYQGNEHEMENKMNRK